MDIFNLILLLVVIILVINNKTNINQKFSELEYRITQLQNLLKQQYDKERKVPEAPAKVVTETVKPPSPVEIKPAELPKPVELPKPPVEVKQPPAIVEKQKEVFAHITPPITKPVKEWEPISQKSQEPEVPKLSFFERYPDLEKFIGENLVNKIGIAILVLAIGFFVKYAIDYNWVGPVGRVGIGIVCGGILIGFAHRMRNSYKAFSSVLVGGGIAIFYFTITLAFQQFHLFTQMVALIILIAITLFTVSLSLLYDKQELAVIALIGGFGSPFMVSNGSANYNGLLLYLLILNAGLLVIAYYKAWRVLNISSFVLSVAIFATVMATMPVNTYYIAFRYATIFYLMFFTINIINNVRENKKFIAIDFTIILTNTALYFAAGLYLLTEMQQPQFRGLFSAGLGALNLVLSYILFRNKKVDPNVLYLLIGITLTFISLTAPIQLHGNNITLFWASEAILLYWLYQKSNINLMKLTSLLVWLAMMLSLFMDLSVIYSNADTRLTIIANKGFITSLFAAISSYMLYLLVKKDLSPAVYDIAISKTLYRAMALLLLFSSGLLEVNHQFEYYYPNTGLNVLYAMLYVPVFVYLFIILSAKITGAEVDWRISLSLVACTIGVYLMFNPQYFDLLTAMLTAKKINTTLFAGHWISDIFIGLLFYKLISLFRDNLSEEQQTGSTWLIVAAIITFLSLEICLLSDLIILYWCYPGR